MRCAESAGRPAARKRLLVTEAERLRYSRRRLRALSRLREAGLEPDGGMEKVHLLPSSTRLGYRVTLLSGASIYCERLADVEACAADYRLWRRSQSQPRGIPLSFAAWQFDPMQQMLALVKAGLWREGEPMLVYRAVYVPPAPFVCGWPECGAPANGTIQGQALCVSHAMLYGQVAELAQRVGRR